MVNQNSCPFLFLMLCIFLCGSVLFLCGFFPDAYIKEDNTEQNQYDQRPTDIKKLRVTPPKPKYEQIVLMIVDALRFGFVYPSDHMPFLHSDQCHRLKLRVAIPTVTMPRIKSLMTGTISNFIDIIRNLGETEQLHDSLIHVLKRNNRSINFVGDRTWTELFPTEFTRKVANMDSFFVHDFYEGDRLVVESLRKEIDERDWSLLILHFLGLDHIGHVEGSNSPKIPAKLKEMDNVISEISKNKYFGNRLVLVTGDHGMREGGGHGGSTEEEIIVPLLAFNRNCSKNHDPTKEYNQIDLTPTLAILMGVEIPKPSIGCLIPELLQNFSQEERLYAYFYNAHHLVHKAKAKYGEGNVKSDYIKWFEEAQIAHRDYMDTRRKGMPGLFYYEQALKNYHRVSNEISKKMSESLVAFDYGLISIGIFLTTSVTVYTLICVFFAENRQNQHVKKSSLIFNIVLWIVSLTLAFILNITSQQLDLITVDSFKRNCLFTAAIAVGIFISLRILRKIQQLVLPLPSESRLKRVWSFPKLLTAAFVMTIVLLASSSYIEYEERTWHYLGVTCLFWLIARNVHQELFKEEANCKNGRASFISFLKKKKSKLFLILTIFTILRFLSGLNLMSKIRWAPWLQVFKQFYLSVLFIGSLIFLLLCLKRFLTPHQRKTSVAVAVCIALFRGFQGKIIFFPHVELGSYAALYLFWISTLLTGLANYATLLSKDGKRSERLLRNFYICSIWVAALLHQTHNIILLPCLLFVLEHAYNFCDNLKIYNMREPYNLRYKLACKTFLTLFISNMFFFYQGNSNSLATIDLNPGYIGQSTYNPVIVVFFVTLNTYSAPINAFFFFALHLLKNEHRYSFQSINIISAPKTYFTGLSNSENIPLVMTLYTVAMLLPVAVYLGLMILFRYHLFIYSVFAPKVFYECYRIVVYSLIYAGFHMFMYVFN